MELDDEYLKLFKNNKDEWGSLNETPRYNNLPNLNETPDLSLYRIDENVNDAWGNLDIQIETRVNGMPQQNNPYYNPHVKRAHQVNDPNGLNNFLQEDNINEVIKHPQPIQGPTFEDSIEPMINENINDVGIVSWELFEKINQKAFLALAKVSDVRSIDVSMIKC